LKLGGIQACDNEIAIIELTSFAFTWLMLRGCIGIDAIISRLCSWGVRSKKKAKEEEYQVHKRDFFL